MEEVISNYILIILSDEKIREKFLLCLNQYVTNGNNGRNFKLEAQLKKELSCYIFQNQMENF